MAPANETDINHLKRCIELAKEALAGGNDPFGSLIVSADGNVLFEDFNRTADGNDTRHPELAIALWAAEHMTAEERAKAIVYTSGEHCAMCSAAHAWAGLGKIVYAGSTEQLTQWMPELNASSMPIKPLNIKDVTVNIPTEGPFLEFADELRELHR
jgi:tRNA(Arg) A34 adenosine deaminase TadA